MNGGNAGALATAAMAAWAGATAFWFGIGTMIWRLFFEPRIKELQKQLDNERALVRERDAEWQRQFAAERERCSTEVNELRDRIKQLETVWLLQTPQQMRSQVQAALSEQHAELDAIRKEMK